MSDGSRFQVSTTYGSGVMGVESSAIETNGVSELLKLARVRVEKSSPRKCLGARFRVRVRVRVRVIWVKSMDPNKSG